MSRIVGWLKGLSDLIYPNRCLFCGDRVLSQHGKLCDSCMKRVDEAENCLCPACGKAASECDCGAFYLKREIFPCTRLAVVTFYSPDPNDRSLEVVRHLILHCKSFYSPELAVYLARRLGFHLQRLFEQNGEALGDWVVTCPPRSADNLMKFGFDHGEMLAEALAKELGVPFRKTLFRVSGEKQKELDGEARYGNAASSLACIRNAVVRGQKYILVDDVITTGATAAVAADLLYRNGAAAVLPAAPAKTVMKGRK